MLICTLPHDHDESLGTPRSEVSGDRCAPGTSVEFAPHGHGAAVEAFIETVRWAPGRVEVDVLLADGSDATASLDAHDWDWLELSAGDIVPVRCLDRGTVSA